MSHFRFALLRFCWVLNLKKFYASDVVDITEIMTFSLGFAVIEEMFLIVSWHQGLIPKLMSRFLNDCLAMSTEDLTADFSWRTHKFCSTNSCPLFQATSGRRLVESAQSDRGFTELTSDRSERQFAASIHSTRVLI